MASGDFKWRKTDLKKIYDSPKKRVSYDSSLMGFQPISGDGKLVRVAIIDSGCPIHKDLKIDLYNTKNFSQSGSIYDVFGHSTAVAGIIAANGQNGIRGLAPSTDLYFAKCLLDENGEGGFDSVIESIFWSITREVDIIIMAFGSLSDYQPLKDAITKAYKQGISIFSASGNSVSKTNDAQYPARYDEVFSVGFDINSSSNKPIFSGENARGIIIPSMEFETTFTDSKFATMKGSSMCTAAIAGLGVLVFQKLRQKGMNIKNPQNIYNEIANLSIKK